MNKLVDKLVEYKKGLIDEELFEIFLLESGWSLITEEILTLLDVGIIDVEEYI